jgi:hypothetical protein
VNIAIRWENEKDIYSVRTGCGKQFREECIWVIFSFDLLQ